MKNKLFRWFKYRLTRLYLKIIGVKLSLDSTILNDEQKKGVRIVKMLATDKDSEILMAPISNRYFIKNDEIFVVLDLYRITVINSVYHYDIHVTENTSSELAAFMRRIIEKKRSLMEKEMRAKIEKSLDHIVVHLTEKFNKKGEA
jgi:hypothetical protein